MHLKLLTVALAVSLFSPVSQAACDTPAYSQFDFWLGDWAVTTPDGKQAGTNQISKAYDGCVITEHYSNAAGPYGTSLNIYDQSTGTWHQTWVDRTGLRLMLDGNLQGNQMILSGKTLSKDGETVQHRIIWTDNDDGTVLQHWAVVQPGESQWQTLFKGVYTKQ
ncbi:hypothetical protein [Alteromonas sp. CYL-A6]|uniref:hypothetical protein n=1 Tax=Alteromonas nitratireducens TaxID=3390813 RepID=UPI0034B5A175